MDGVHDASTPLVAAELPMGAGNEGGGDVGGTVVKLSIAVVSDLWTSRR